MSTYENNEQYLNEDPLENLLKKLNNIFQNADEIIEEQKNYPRKRLFLHLYFYLLLL